jgi:hypothetical protein
MPEAALELRLPEPLSLSEPAEVALEDYARVVTRSARAAAVRGAEPGSPVVALRLYGREAPPEEPAWRDVVAFGRELAKAGQGSGLGWS